MIETKENKRIRERCQECWELSQRYLPIEVIGQGDQREMGIGPQIVDSQPTNPIAALDVWIRELAQV
jgi:hypothetical protein